MASLSMLSAFQSSRLSTQLPAAPFEGQPTKPSGSFTARLMSESAQSTIMSTYLVSWVAM